MSIALTKMKEYDKELTAIKEVLNLLEWDQSTIMPKKGIEGRSLQVSVLSKRYHEMITSNEFVHSINSLSKKTVYDSLKPLEKDTVRKYKKMVDRRIRIPIKHVEEFSKLASEAQHQWEIAKNKNDYSIFKPYLKKIIEMKRKEAEYIDAKAHPYEVLLDEYEEGMKIEKVKEEFQKLELGLKKLEQKIRNSKKNKEIKEYFTKINNTKIPLEELKKINHDFAELILVEKDRYNLFESVHPFTATVSQDDVRITTSYNNLMFSIGATIHEAGHALYELSFDRKLRGTVLADAPSLGIHESQSRYWENHVGTSPEFWKNNYSVLKKYMDKMTLTQFYNGINHSEPNLIRVKSDEVTYPMHIIIRFQIELGLIEGKISVNELPKIWNQKYNELIGVSAKKDSEGVLQDVHWSSGYFGYFPTYAIGTMYSAIIDEKMRQEIKDYDKKIEENKFNEIREWLKKNVHSYGSRLTAEEIIFKATGSKLQSETLLSYLERKYSKIYGF